MENKHKIEIKNVLKLIKSGTLQEIKQFFLSEKIEKYGDCILYYAAKNKDFQVIKFFVDKYGMDINKPCKSFDSGGSLYPLSKAAHEHNMNVMIFLIARKADTTKVDALGWNVLNILIHNGYYKDAKIIKEFIDKVN